MAKQNKKQKNNESTKDKTKNLRKETKDLKTVSKNKIELIEMISDNEPNIDSLSQEMSQKANLCDETNSKFI